MKKIITIDGNEACARSAYMFSEIAGIYPITPSSPMAEHIDEWASKDVKNLFNDKVKVVEMQSEAGAAGFIHGALQTGALATTFTASQGLLLMLPNMYKIAGEMLPCVMHVAARSLSTHALSIFGDHQDIYAARQTGFAFLASSNVQDCTYLSAVAHLSSIDSSIPFLHFFDGFRTSHEINKINVLELDDYKKLINMEALNKFRERSLNPLTPKTIGVAENDDIYFQATEIRNKFYNKIPDIVNDYMEKTNELAGTDYKPFNYYGDLGAKKIIVAMGSVCETIKEVIDSSNEKLGLIEVHLYRPFSTKYFLNILPFEVTSIAVIDRTKEPGSVGEPLFLDVSATLLDKDIKVVGGRYGLSSKNTTPSQINAIYDMLDNPKHNFTIGINDDITNLSLKDIPLRIKNSKELLFYGYGSDGMVSASKSIIKLIGDNTDNYVQGYFQYDSKKSGGVTLSHLRISNNIIRSTYYVEEPDILVLSKDNYLTDFEIIESISENGVFIVNTNKSSEELINSMSDNLKCLFISKNIKIYSIDANNIAVKVGLKDKISMIMEYAILYITKIIDCNLAKQKLIEYIKDKFSKKGENIVVSNIEALNLVENSIKNISIIGNYTPSDDMAYDMYEMMLKRQGNNLPVSSFLENPDGTFPKGISNIEKRCISSLAPKWINTNCIECNMCTLVCPHSVIRTFILDKNEYDNSPLEIKNRCKESISPKGYYYIVSASVKDCTGCGLCINNCPGIKGEKALLLNSFSEEQNEQEVFDYLNNNIKDKKLFKSNTIKGCGLKEPKIKYCGACAGCGEPNYIKILTQICGDNLVVANATGCSSIYGASAPSTAYTIPWASSLFEDNAEYGYGMLMATNTIRNRIKAIMENNMENSNSELFKLWLNNYDNYEITKNVYDNLNDDIPNELKSIKDYIISRNIWCIGGDGWAYDIGFGGIDHVLSSNDNINILVLDTEVYSNTGGQSSKSSRIGSIASFTTSGKKNSRKDLARIAMSYPNCYVATVSLGANLMQTINAINEANNHKGPSIVIAYSPCISHGIKGGMSNSILMEKMATNCGYFPTFRYSPITGFVLDSKNVDFDKYDEFLNFQTRYSMLKKINPIEYNSLFKSNKQNSIQRYNYYKSLQKVND